MQTISVKGQDPYDIKIEKGLIAKCGHLIRTVSAANKVMLITDSNVSPLYEAVVCDSLRTSGYETSSHIFIAGEKSKHIGTVTGMLESLAEARLGRDDLVVALGGGVCGDLAGFAAAIYLRGIDFVQIPTTLLAQIDSSVGGKTGCDLPAQKNLVGAFHNPKLVLIDPDVLDTLPGRYMRDGMGEAVKYGCIASESLFKKASSSNYKDYIEEIIEECVERKRDIVERDFKESGERMLLNFGHTIAHSIEAYYNYERESHGEAVGIGMVLITEAAEKAGLTEEGTSDRIKNALIRLGLPTETDIPTENLAKLAGYDKKRQGQNINLVLPRRIGAAFIHPIAQSDLPDFINGKI